LRRAVDERGFGIRLTGGKVADEVVHMTLVIVAGIVVIGLGTLY
jgi:hypothetical protein